MYSAGILPYTVIDSKIYMLLGRETYDMCYSDFGGKFERHDSSILHTACREFTEESLFDEFDILTFLTTKDQCMHTLYTESRTLKGNIYYMFLVHLDINMINLIQRSFNKKYTDKFSGQNAHPCNLEKDKIKLFRLDDILQLPFEVHSHPRPHPRPHPNPIPRSHLNPYPNPHPIPNPHKAREAILTHAHQHTPYKLRPVFQNTIHMHSAFLLSLSLVNSPTPWRAHISHNPGYSNPVCAARWGLHQQLLQVNESEAGWTIAGPRRPRTTLNHTLTRPVQDVRVKSKSHPI